MIREDGRLIIRGTCCPVRALVPAHPLTCKSVEALLTEVAGVPVRERCVKGARPSCRLEIAGEDGSAGGARQGPGR